jgi:tRNA A-37 threonylcarbamoyl transferase component Bud32
MQLQECSNILLSQIILAIKLAVKQLTHTSQLSQLTPRLRKESTETVTDTVGSDIVPYLIHFSKMGIVPIVVGVKAATQARSEVMMVNFKGQRLDYLLENGNYESLIRTYLKLGIQTGYTLKYDVFHNDLHTENVLVRRGEPKIIDWEEAMIGIKSCDDLHLLKDTEIVLRSHDRSYMYSALERAFRAGYGQEGSKPIKTTLDEIRDTAFKEFGVI